MSSGLDTLGVFEMPLSEASVHVVQPWASGEGRGKVRAMCVGVMELIREDELIAVNKKLHEKYNLGPKVLASWREARSVWRLGITDMLHSGNFSLSYPPDHPRGREVRATLLKMKVNPLTTDGFHVSFGNFQGVRFREFLMNNEEFRKEWSEAVLLLVEQIE